MKEEGEYSYRAGPGIKWQMVAKQGAEIISGFTIDNLDKKTLKEADSDFEKVFVGVRIVLEELSSKCLDNESERLEVSQKVAEFFKKNKIL